MTSLLIQSRTQPRNKSFMKVRSTTKAPTTKARWQSQLAPNLQISRRGPHRPKPHFQKVALKEQRARTISYPRRARMAISKWWRRTMKHRTPTARPTTALQSRKMRLQDEMYHVGMLREGRLLWASQLSHRNTTMGRHKGRNLSETMIG